MSLWSKTKQHFSIYLYGMTEGY